METTIRRIAPGSVFKISFVLYGLLGLLLGFFYGVLFFVTSQLGSRALGPGMDSIFRVGGGFGSIAVFFFGIVGAFFYAVVSAAITALGAVIYNLLAGAIGGIRVTLAPEIGVVGFEHHPPYPQIIPPPSVSPPVPPAPNVPPSSPDAPPTPPSDRKPSPYAPPTPPSVPEPSAYAPPTPPSDPEPSPYAPPEAGPNEPDGPDRGDGS